MRKKKEILCIIHARGGSKGIPDKNIIKIQGKPLLVYTLEQALATKSITRIVVSTDDSQIAQIASDYKVEVILRPDYLSNDQASSESAIIHVVDELEKKEDYIPEIIVFLQATSPIRQANDIEYAIAKLVKEKADSLFSACRLH